MSRSFGGQRIPESSVEGGNIEHKGQRHFAVVIYKITISTDINSSSKTHVGKSREVVPTPAASISYAAGTGSSVKTSSPYSCDSIKPIGQ